MSSSANNKTVKPKKSRSRVGPPLTSKELEAVKAKQRSDQQARTEARAAALTSNVPDEAGDPPLVDLYEVGRVNVLNREVENFQELTSGDIAIIDLSESAGPWTGERRPFGLVLTRGQGELLIITDTCCQPGQFNIRYDSPFPDRSDRPE